MLGIMRIIDAARSVGVHPVTLKRLEKKGVIHPIRDRNGWRRYTADDLKKVKDYFFPGEKSKLQVGK